MAAFCDVVLPPEHRWPSEGHRLDAIRRCVTRFRPGCCLLARTGPG